MSKNSPYPEFDLLLPCVDAVSADLALSLLRENEIPSVLSGENQFVVEFGTESQRSLWRQDIFVPRGARPQARRVLVDAWGEAAVAAHEAALYPAQDASD
jgi:hypothetical protein